MGGGCGKNTDWKPHTVGGFSGAGRREAAAGLGGGLSGGAVFLRGFELARKLVTSPHSSCPAGSRVGSASDAPPPGHGPVFSSGLQPQPMEGADSPCLLASGSQAILLKHRYDWAITPASRPLLASTDRVQGTPYAAGIPLYVRKGVSAAPGLSHW